LRGEQGVALAAHAKLNLTLEVLSARPDANHEVVTWLQAISLHDLLLVEPASTTSLEGGHGPEDLVLQAQRALEAAAGRRLPARFRLVKRIPVGSGLGGGSSDAAAALRALSRLHGLVGIDLEPVAAEVGVDVVFLLRGGAAEARGRGERLRPAPPAAGWFAIAWPGFEVSTRDVYARWDEVGGDGANHLTRSALAVEPRLDEFARRLGEGWRMTGTGSAFFRCCETRQEAEGAVDRLDCWTVVARPVGAFLPPGGGGGPPGPEGGR
jgi:4-diphosphocytidyl-2-C-methyl-D-erythritol kinase